MFISKGLIISLFFLQRGKFVFCCLKLLNGIFVDLIDIFLRVILEASIDRLSKGFVRNATPFPLNVTDYCVEIMLQNDPSLDGNRSAFEYPLNDLAHSRIRTVRFLGHRLHVRVYIKLMRIDHDLEFLPNRIAHRCYPLLLWEDLESPHML